MTRLWPGSHNNTRVIIEGKSSLSAPSQVPNTCAARLPSARSLACLYCARPDNDSYYAASMTSNDNHSPRYQWCQWQSQNPRGIITNTINSLVLASSIIRNNTEQNITTYKVQHFTGKCHYFLYLYCICLGKKNIWKFQFYWIILTDILSTETQSLRLFAQGFDLISFHKEIPRNDWHLSRLMILKCRLQFSLLDWSWVKNEQNY